MTLPSDHKMKKYHNLVYGLNKSIYGKKNNLCGHGMTNSILFIIL